MSVTVQPSMAIRLVGTEEPVPPATELHAGPLRCRLDGGNLRHIEIAGHEAIRAIAFLVRDRDWGTFNPAIEDLRVEQRDDGFTVTYTARCADAAQALRYAARIEGAAEGTVRFTADATAETDVVTNRTGFVVLHPIAGVAGAPVRVLHVDGTVEDSRFPALVEPDCPFRDVRALTHAVAPGLEVTCTMEGDAFEMEDHRNWTDASYKTYVRPLARPWPYTIPAGERFTQRVTAALAGRVPPPAAAAGEAPVLIALGPAGARTMPPLGLALDPDHVAGAEAAAAMLRAAAPAFLVVHHDPTRGHEAGTLARAAALAASIGAELVLEAVVPCRDAQGRPTADPAVLRADMAAIAATVAAAGVRPGRVIVSPACDLKCTLPGSVFAPAPRWDELAAAARAALPGAAIGGGMLSYFTELNRKRPPRGLFDLIGHTICPIVHAGDDAALTETLEALPAVFASAAAIAGETPCWLYPSAIAMRANPYGAAPAENPGNLRQAMNRVDPRERGLLGAAWYLGCLAHAARSSLAAVTLAAAAGPSGIAWHRQPHAQPWLDTAGALVLPSWHVVAQLAAARGRPVLETRSSAPRDVQVLALGGARTSVWLANLTARERSVLIEGLPAEGLRRWSLDAAAFAAACVTPLAHAAGSDPLAAATLTLGPYATVRLDAG